MHNIIFAISSIAPLFVMIALGFFLKSKRIIDRNYIDITSDFVFRYLFPLNMFRQIYQSDITSDFNPVFIGYGIAICLLLVLLLWLVVPHFISDKRTCGAYIQASFRSNCVLMGTSLSIKAFGDAGSLPTITLLPFVTVAFNIISVIVLSAFSADKKKVRLCTLLPDVLKNPLIIGALAGMAVSLAGIRFPPFITEIIDDLSALVTPLALIALGGQLELKSLVKNPVLILSGSLIKLVISPLAAIIPAVLFFNFTYYEMGALFFIFGSSSAVSSFVMAKAMKSDDDFAGQMVMYTTVFSSITMFIWIFALKSLGII